VDLGAGSPVRSPCSRKHLQDLSSRPADTAATLAIYKKLVDRATPDSSCSPKTAIPRFLDAVDPDI